VSPSFGPLADGTSPPLRGIGGCWPAAVVAANASTIAAKVEWTLIMVST
jgi:hypothetical protein